MTLLGVVTSGSIAVWSFAEQARDYQRLYWSNEQRMTKWTLTLKSIVETK